MGRDYRDFVAEFGEFTGGGMDVKRGGGGLASKFAQAGREELLFREREALRAEEDNVAARDQGGQVSDELVAVWSRQKTGELEIRTGEFGADVSSGVEVRVGEERGGRGESKGGGESIGGGNTSGFGSSWADGGGRGLNRDGSRDGKDGFGCGWRRHC